MSICSDKLAHVQLIRNCRYSVAQRCTRKDMLAHYLGALYLDDVMSHNELTTHPTLWRSGFWSSDFWHYGKFLGAIVKYKLGALVFASLVSTVWTTLV